MDGSDVDSEGAHVVRIRTSCAHSRASWANRAGHRHNERHSTTNSTFAGVVQKSSNALATRDLVPASTSARRTIAMHTQSDRCCLLRVMKGSVCVFAPLHAHRQKDRASCKLQVVNCCCCCKSEAAVALSCCCCVVVLCNGNRAHQAKLKCRVQVCGTRAFQRRGDDGCNLSLSIYLSLGRLTLLFAINDARQSNTTSTLRRTTRPCFRSLSLSLSRAHALTRQR